MNKLECINTKLISLVRNTFLEKNAAVNTELGDTALNLITYSPIKGAI